jgi:membrane fusion protein, heavy metal efflux system
MWIAREAIEKGAVEMVEARTQPLAEPLISDGRIAFDDLRVSHVFSPVTGRVTRVLAELGQPIEKGSPLAVIVSPDVGTAFSDEVKARADLVATEREHKRQQQLFAEQAGLQRDLETAENAYRKAQVEEQRALQKVRLLSEGTVNAVTQEYVLQSPIAGRVVARMVTPGVEVQGQYSAGTAVELFTVGNTDTVWLYADVPEAELAELQAGAAATARVLAYPASVFEGNVEWVSTALDPALRTARLRVSLPNPEALLKPEMFATVYVRRPSAEKLAVPRAAVVRINEQSFVYVAGEIRSDGKQTFKRRHVQVAAPTGPPRKGVLRSAGGYSPGMGGAHDMVAVLSGLSEGERVLVESAESHQDGADKVSVTKEQMASGKLGTAAVEEQEVSNTVTVGGRLTFDDLRVTHVFSPVSGRVTRIMAAPGEHVKKGAPLAVILSPDLGSAFSDELKAAADLLAAEKEVKRQRELYTLQATARHDLEVAEDNYDRAKAEHERALQKTSLLRDGALDAVNQEYVLRSPIDGDVVARMANPGLEVQGQYSGASNVVELFTIGSIDDLWLLGDVYEVDLSSVKPGAPVELQVPAYPGRSFRGTADWVSDTLDPVLRTAKVRVVLENPQGVLRPEMYGVARITAPAQRTVTVPRDAIMRLGDETIVFVEGSQDADGGVTFQRRAVIADEQLAGGAVPVVGALQAGERVATRGAIFLLGML